MTDKNIQMIAADRLYPHPNNPRKDLGDLTELVDSIKKNGIFQNLTVVPRGDNDYTVIIGHRRRAAGMKAGVSHFPCVVMQMSEREQLATMLAENMQRSDLTVLEQAEGIQMMLDFGDSVEDVSEATGLSQTTVRRRARIARYDREKVKASFERGATVMDFEELEKVKSAQLRAEVLEYIGTNNFSWKLQQAIRQEKDTEYLDSVEKKVSEFAAKTENDDGLDFVTSYRPFIKEEVKAPEDGRKYLYLRTSNSVLLYAEIGEEEIAQKQQEEVRKRAYEEERDEKIAELDRIAEQAYESRKEFIRSVYGLDKLREVVISFAIWVMSKAGYYGVDDVDFSEVYGEDCLKKAVVGEFDDIQPEKALLITAYCRLRDSENNKYGFCYSTKYRSNAELDRLYEFLTKLGYELSDEEQAWKNGVHESWEGGNTDEKT